MTCGLRRGCIACQNDLPTSPLIYTPYGGLFQCPACGSLTCVPRPTPELLRALHNDPAYFSHPYFQKRRINQLGMERRCHKAFRPVLASMDAALLQGERMLDIGCDTGAFLSTARKLYGIMPVGLDVSTRAVDQALANGMEVYETALEEAPTHLRDLVLITALDVLEHVTDPAGLLTAACARLRPGGLLYVETPNVRSTVYRVGWTLSRLTGNRPRALFDRLFPAEHVQYFSEKGLKGLAVECGFEMAYLGKRRLIWEDMATGLAVRIGLQALQAIDDLLGEEHLLCALFRRPLTHEGTRTAL